MAHVFLTCAWAFRFEFGNGGDGNLSDNLSHGFNNLTKNHTKITQKYSDNPVYLGNCIRELISDENDNQECVESLKYFSSNLDLCVTTERVRGKYEKMILHFFCAIYFFFTFPFSDFGRIQIIGLHWNFIQNR